MAQPHLPPTRGTRFTAEASTEATAVAVTAAVAVDTSKQKRARRDSEPNSEPQRQSPHTHAGGDSERSDPSSAPRARMLGEAGMGHAQQQQQFSAAQRSASDSLGVVLSFLRSAQESAAAAGVCMQWRFAVQRAAPRKAWVGFTLHREDRSEEHFTARLQRLLQLGWLGTLYRSVDLGDQAAPPEWLPLLAQLPQPAVQSLCLRAACETFSQHSSVRLPSLTRLHLVVASSSCSPWSASAWRCVMEWLCLHPQLKQLHLEVYTPDDLEDEETPDRFDLSSLQRLRALERLVLVSELPELGWSRSSALLLSTLRALPELAALGLHDWAPPDCPTIAQLATLRSLTHLSLSWEEAPDPPDWDSLLHALCHCTQLRRLQFSVHPEWHLVGSDMKPLTQLQQLEELILVAHNADLGDQLRPQDVPLFEQLPRLHTLLIGEHCSAATLLRFAAGPIGLRLRALPLPNYDRGEWLSSRDKAATTAELQALTRLPQLRAASPDEPTFIHSLFGLLPVERFQGCTRTQLNLRREPDWMLTEATVAARLPCLHRLQKLRLEGFTLSAALAAALLQLPALRELSLLDPCGGFAALTSLQHLARLSVAWHPCSTPPLPPAEEQLLRVVTSPQQLARNEREVVRQYLQQAMPNLKQLSVQLDDSR